MLYNFIIVDVEFFSYKYSQTLRSLTSDNSYMQSKKDRREYHITLALNKNITLLTGPQNMQCCNINMAVEWKAQHRGRPLILGTGSGIWYSRSKGWASAVHRYTPPYFGRTHLFTIIPARPSANWPQVLKLGETAPSANWPQVLKLGEGWAWSQLTTMHRLETHKNWWIKYHTCNSSVARFWQISDGGPRSISPAKWLRTCLCLGKQIAQQRSHNRYAQTITQHGILLSEAYVTRKTETRGKWMQISDLSRGEKP